MYNNEPQQNPHGGLPGGRVHPADGTNRIASLIREAFSMVHPDEEGWVGLGALGHKIKVIDSAFSPAQFGFMKLSELVEGSGIVETRRDETRQPPAVYCRLRRTNHTELPATSISRNTQWSQRPARSGESFASAVPRAPHEPYRSGNAVAGRPNVAPRAPRPPKLTDWAFFPAFRNPEEIRYRSLLPVGFARGWFEAIGELRKKTLREPWEFGGVESPENPSPILQSYLWWTFHRLWRERKIMQVGDYAAFNTGLVDPRYEQIYALFDANRTPGRQPWVFQGFCTHGERGLGERLVRSFRPLPAPAHYFEHADDLIYDLKLGEPLLKDHLIEDNVDRFPLTFIREHCPAGFTPRDCTTMRKYEIDAYSQDFRDAIRNDHKKARAMINVVKDALETALKRVRWNFKTAIPQYYPTKNHMNLLLPLAIVSDEVTDLAMVVEKVESQNYLGHTVLRLDWAYNNARLVCRPNSDWLDPREIKQGEAEISEEGQGESETDALEDQPSEAGEPPVS